MINMIIMKCVKCNHEQKVHYGEWNCSVCRKDNNYNVLDVIKTMDVEHLRNVKKQIDILIRQNMVV